VVALDTFEEHINGTRQYIVTLIDLYTRFGSAITISSHISLATASFFALWQSVFSFPFTHCPHGQRQLVQKSLKKNHPTNLEVD
jgi:hypothetical protein